MFTLGINSIYHDSAACLVRDGVVVAAVEEERFSGVRHQKRPLPYEAHGLPFHAIDSCLKLGGITLSDVDHVAYSFNPFYLIGPGTQQQTISFPTDASQIPGWEGYNEWKTVFLAAALAPPNVLLETDNLADRTEVPYHLLARFQGEQKFEFHFVDHQLCHAAGAFLPSPFPTAAILTLDGVGESAATTYGTGNGMEVDIFGEVHRPNSLGKFWEHVTAYLGFRRVSQEPKVVAMSSYAKPTYLSQFLEIVQIRQGGSYVINPYDLVEEFGPARQPGQPIEPRHYEIAASIQAALESVVLDLVSWLSRETGEENLCISGGVALNCALSTAVRDKGPFKNVWIQPAANDAGTALGGALVVDAHKRGEDARRVFPVEQAFLGPDYADDEVETCLRWARLPYRRVDDVAREVARMLAHGDVVGWFQGRMEFGPRALGARSILASPVDPAMKGRLNAIKGREDFLPVASAVIEAKAAEWFAGAGSSPFQLFNFPLREDKRGRVPSLAHVDGSVRIQTVTPEQNGRFHDLLSAFEELTGVPVLLTTSLSNQEEPIVCTPRQAIETFWVTPLDALAIGPFLLEKPRSG